MKVSPMNEEFSKRIGNVRYCTNQTLPLDEYGRKKALEPYRAHVRRKFVIKSRYLQPPTNDEIKNTERIKPNEDTSCGYVKHLKNSLDKKGLEVTTLYSRNRLSMLSNTSEETVKSATEQESKKPKNPFRFNKVQKRKLGDVSSTKKFNYLFDKDDSYLKLLPPAMTNDLTCQ